MISSNHSRRGSDMNSSSHSSGKGGRIPAALQAIFLASNGGQEVNEPPKNLGFKVFSRILGRNKSKAQVYDRSVILESSPENDEVSQTCHSSGSSIFRSSETSKLTRSCPFLNTARDGNCQSTGFSG
jgi:hypothetical protein